MNKKEFEEILSELVGEPVEMNFKGSFEKNGLDNEIILGMMLCKHLTAINDTLYKISVSLDDLNEKLDGCISKNGKNNFLCVTGNISTY